MFIECPECCGFTVADLSANVVEQLGALSQQPEADGSGLDITKDEANSIGDDVTVAVVASGAFTAIFDGLPMPSSPKLAAAVASLLAEVMVVVGFCSLIRFCAGSSFDDLKSSPMPDVDDATASVVD